MIKSRRCPTEVLVALACSYAFLSSGCASNRNTRADVIDIDGVPHRAVYKDCVGCERVGYLTQTCRRCNGKGQAMFPCYTCFTTGTATTYTPQGPVTGTCSKCSGKGKFLGECPVKQRDNCRPCEGSGRVFVRYEVIPAD